MKAGERGSAGYFEALGKQRGVSTEALAPYIAQLREAEAAQKKATASLGTMGVSAGQTAAALRQVPAQFTDIVTSLQAGQAPLTVLLQQGGQLKDSFGGAGAAAKALGSYVLGLVNPFTVAAAAVAGLAFAYVKGADEAQAFQKTLILTGNAAGVTARQLGDIAASISGFGVTQGAAADALNQLAATGKVGADNLARFASAAVQLQRVGGPAVDETVKAFAELAKSPLQASLKLNESTNFLTTSLYQQIKALEEQGRSTEAAKVAQEAFAAVIEDRFPKLEKNLGIIESRWLAIKDAIKGAADSALNIGRPETLDELQRKLFDLQGRRAEAGANGFFTGTRRTSVVTAELDAEIQKIEKQTAELLKQQFIGETLAQQESERLKAVQARSEFDKIVGANLDKEAKLKLEIQRIENLGLAAGKTRAEIETQIAAAKERARDKSIDGAAQRAMQQEAALLERLAGLSGTYVEDLQRLDSARRRGVLTEEQYVATVKELIAKQPFAVKLEKEQADASKQVADAMARGNELYLKKIDALEQAADAVGKQVQKLHDEEEALGVSAALNISLAQAIELVTIKRLQEQQVAAKGDQPTIDAIQREIDQRRELAQLIGRKDTREAAKKSAEDAAKEWKRASDEIERTITDALMRGFESGKSFVQTLRDTLVNTFKTLVLRPTIQAAVQPLAQSLTGGFGGLLGSGNTGIGGGLGSLGGVNSALDKLGLGGIASALNTIAGPLASLYNISKGKYATGIGSGIGSVLGGLPGLAIGNAIGSALDKVFSGGAGTPHMGADYISTATGGYRPGANEVGIYSAGASVNQNRSQAVEDALKVLTGTGAGLLNTLAASFGQPANYAVGGYFAADGRDPAQANTRITAGGQTISSTATRYGVSGAKEGLDAFTAELAGQVRSALASMDIPEWAKSQLDALANSASFDDLANAVQSITATSSALKQLGDVMPQLSGLTGAAVDGLLKAMGGIDNLRTAASSYYDNFYSDAEKTASATVSLTKELAAFGIAVPGTREAYRALVEAQDLNTESGRAAYAELLKLSPAFAALVPATAQLAQEADNSAAAMQAAAEKMAEAGRKVLADLADQQSGLQVDLLRAQGQLVAAAELERRNALAKLTEGLSSQDAAAATASFDFNAALRAQIEALKDAAAAAQQAAQAEEARAAAEAQRIAAVAQERTGLETQILQLEGNKAALRAQEIAAVDESNRVYVERIHLLQDEQAEQQRLAAVATERYNLDGQYLQLIGDTAALRERELQATDESNRARLREIFALQDQKAAQDAAAKAAQDAAAALQQAAQAEQQRLAAIASQRDGLIGRLLQAQGDVAALRQRELDALDPTNRAILEQIYALEDKKAADEAAAQAAREAAQAAEQLRSAWQSITDSLLQEVQRIRGLISGNGQQSLAGAQAQFAVTTAQARAGDQEAAKLLPGLSQTLLQLAEANAGSLIDLQRIRAQIAASLEQTGLGLAGRFGLSLPKFDVGTNYVPRDMAAIVHEGEAIVPRAFNPAAGGASNNGALVNEVKGLREENRAQALAIVKLQTEISKMLKKWDSDGIPEERRVTA